MKKGYVISCVVMVMLSLVGCGVKRSQAYYDQPSKLLSVNYDGTYVLRVQVRARNAALAFDDARRKAVEEIIFDGVKAGSSGVSDLKPLIFDKNAREKHADYFYAFFMDKGDWKRYTSLEDRRAFTSTYQRTEAQMVQVVTVRVDRVGLQRRLKADGIIPPGDRYKNVEIFDDIKH